MSNPNAPCMVNGECSKRFPKSFQDSTSLDVDAYPAYRRPDNGRTVLSGGQVLDNRWIVPYNPFLSIKYNAHINVEVCALIQVVKYLYKYVYKGPDRASLILSRSTMLDGHQIDEINKHLDARYVCAPEAAHHLFGFHVQKKSHAIERLMVHLPDYQSVTFTAGNMVQALRNAATRDTTLTAWFKCNQRSAAVAEGREQPEPGCIDSLATP